DVVTAHQHLVHLGDKMLLVEYSSQALHQQNNLGGKRGAEGPAVPNLFPKKHSGSSRGAVGSTSRTDWPVGQILKTIYQREEEKSAN
ncbi:Potassium-transporting ATPase potassium-binding subunit, partial [Frankliniella fusca]